jgi:tetratricopeptide (TPR) repeat protein
MVARAIRLGVVLGVLALFYLGLFVRPPLPEAASEEVDPAREMARETDRLVSASKWGQARGPLEELHRRLPRNLVYVEQLGRVYRKLGLLREEATMLEKFILLSPKPADACPRIGVVYKLQKKIPEAIDAFERCVSFERDDPDLMFQLGLLYERGGRRAKALELYQKGYGIDPKNPDLGVALARMYLHQGDARKALGQVQLALLISPDDVDALLISGMALRNLGRLEEGRTQLERGLTMRNSVELRVALGLLCQLQKRPADAKVQYAEALKIDPNDADVKRRLRQVGGKL